MILIDTFNNSVITTLKSFLNLISFNIDYKTLSPELTVYVKISIGIFNIVLLTLSVLIILNFIINFFFKQNSYLKKLLKFINMFALTILIVLLMFKFYLSLKLENAIGPYIYKIKLDFFMNNNNLNILEHFIAFSSSFSDAILILSFLTGLICIELLGPKNLFQSTTNISIFYAFNVFVTIMVSTNNLLIMFISFELIFLPTIFFVYKLGYSKKIDKAIEALFYWTLFGSFLVLCNLVYIYYNFNTLNYIYLMQKIFSSIETQVLFTVFLIGFGVKIPLAPLHFWLLKVHVESPTAFSIFLSGFLVKSALYCLFMFINIFNTENHHTILIVWVLYSLIVGTLGLAKQVDIKKLIAWATIQEMSFMLMFLLYKQLFLSHTCVLFVVLHGIMSSYMFYIVDIIQRRYNTRALQHIRGLNITLPKITKHIWFLILLFSGFPLTAKFIIEWNLISVMVETNRIVLLMVIFFINFLGVVFFCKHMFTIIYGIPEGDKEDLNFVESQKKEYGMLNFLTFFIIILVWLIYMF